MSKVITRLLVLESLLSGLIIGLSFSFYDYIYIWYFVAMLFTFVVLPLFSYLRKEPGRLALAYILIVPIFCIGILPAEIILIILKHKVGQFLFSTPFLLIISLFYVYPVYKSNRDNIDQVLETMGIIKISSDRKSHRQIIKNTFDEVDQFSKREILHPKKKLSWIIISVWCTLAPLGAALGIIFDFGEYFLISVCIALVTTTLSIRIYRPKTNLLSFTLVSSTFVLLPLAILVGDDLGLFILVSIFFYIPIATLLVFLGPALLNLYFFIKVVNREFFKNKQ